MPTLERSIEPQTGAIDDAAERELVVVHTSVAATKVALQTAAQLGNGLYNRIRLIALRVVPFPLPLTAPPVAERFTEQFFALMAEDFPEVTRVDVVNCRDEAEGLCSALRTSSLVVIGPPRRWWSSREAKLRKAATRAGHTVLPVRMK